MIVLEIFKIVMQTAVLALLLLLCCYFAYSAGRADERDEQVKRRQECADHPIQMDHTHGGEDD